MRVLQTLYSGLGGHGSVVTSLILADKERQWEHCLLFYGVEELLPSYKDFCITNRVSFSFIGKKRGPFQFQWKKIISEFKKYNPDVIILHSPTLIFQAWVYSLFRKKKIIVVEHTPHNSKRVSEKIGSFFSLLMAKRTICLTEEYENEFVRKYRLLGAAKKAVVIENGIDLDSYSPSPATDTYFKIGMIGRFTQQKDQQMIVMALDKLFQNENLRTKVHLYFAGTGETMNDVKILAKERNLENNIHFCGLLNEREIIELLRGLKLYVHASFSETMCTSVMQAMACGLPVVASNIPGINNIVQENRNALLFTNGDIDGLVKNIEFIIGDEKIRKEMSEYAREFSLSHFSSEGAFKKYNLLLQVEKYK